MLAFFNVLAELSIKEIPPLPPDRLNAWLRLECMGDYIIVDFFLFSDGIIEFLDQIVDYN